jgi:nuclease S1
MPRFTFLALLLVAEQVFAFGAFAHRTVITVAEPALSVPAKREIAALLKVAPRATLAELSTWPDEIRDEPDATPEDKQTARWHYMNLPKGSCAIDLQQNCPDGMCLVGQLKVQIALLANKQAPAKQRARALGFVVHLFADLHQPLHLGFAADRGGNDFQISLAKNSGIAPPPAVPVPPGQPPRGANLHALWDTIIFDEEKIGPAAEAKQILALKASTKAQQKLARITDIDAITRESCALVQAPDFYPSTHKVSRAYLEKMRPRAQARVALAGQRLAQLLNQIFAAK